MGWDYLAAMAIAAASSYYTKRQAASADQTRSKFDKSDPALSERGTITNYNIGYWPTTGDLTVATNRKRLDNDIYYEDGMMVLNIGPVYKIDELWENGETIWTGPITRETHPSGTSITTKGNNDGLGKGTFTIYWGEDDQPVCQELVDATGVDANFGGVCFLWWKNKKLGVTPVWPTVEAITTTYPEKSELTGSLGYKDETLTLSDAPSYEFNIKDIHNGKIVIINDKIHPDYEGNPIPLLRVGDPIEVTGNTGVGVNGTYTIKDWKKAYKSYSPLQQASVVLIELEEDTIAFESDGSVIFYERDRNAGANPAHMLDQMLFAQWPYGLEISRDSWDITSLEKVGVVCENEGLWMGIRSNRRDARDLITEILSDAGIIIYFNTDTGKYTFETVRKVNDFEIVDIPSEVIVSDDPYEEITTRASANYQFSFKNALENFRDDTIRVSEDPNDRTQTVDTQELEITTTSDRNTASRIAERRAIEGVSDFSKINFEAAYHAKLLQVGDRFHLDGKSIPYLVLKRKEKFNTPNIELEAVRDRYSSVASDFLHPSGLTLSPEDADAPILLFDVVELPEPAISEFGSMELMYLSVRDNAIAKPPTLWTSTDDNEYVPLLTDLPPVGGGLLSSSFDDSKSILDIQIEILGPDLLDNITDLSNDISSYCSGVFWLVIFEEGSQTDYEIFFVKRVTTVSGNIVEFQDCIRGRRGTRPRSFSVNSRCYFFLSNTDKADFIRVNLGDSFAPGDPIYHKLLGQGDSLSDSDPISLTLKGNNIKPMAPENLRPLFAYVAGQGLDGNIPEFYWKIGDNFTLNWTQVDKSVAYSNGIGAKPPGTPDVEEFKEGTYFIVYWYDQSDTQIDSDTIPGAGLALQATTTPPYTYGLFAAKAASSMAILMSGNTHLYVRIIFYRDGYFSDLSDPIKIVDVT